MSLVVVFLNVPVPWLLVCCVLGWVLLHVGWFVGNLGGDLLLNFLIFSIRLSLVGFGLGGVGGGGRLAVVFSILLGCGGVTDCLVCGCGELWV